MNLEEHAAVNYKAQALALEEHAADAKTIQITSDNLRRDEHQ